LSGRPYHKVMDISKFSVYKPSNVYYYMPELESKF
jgi:hypothetical protein